MQFKIRIFQPVVPDYRKALFEGLGRKYGNRIEIFADARVGVNNVSVPLANMRYNYHCKYHSKFGFIWQTGFTLRGLSRGDVIVVCGDIRQIALLCITVLARLKRIRVVWWGQHKSATSSSLGVRIRLVIAKFLSDVMLCYTRTGVKYLIERGFDPRRVFATGNTIDQTPIKKAIADFKGDGGFNGQTGILCCSVLRPKVKLELLLNALSDRRLRDIFLAVIGGGSELNRYKQMARDLGVERQVRWLGEMRDQHLMAPWFLTAKAYVYPGAVGLGILHSLSYGLPVIVHGNAAHQMPEYEVMENGRTGLCFKEDNADDLAEKILEMISRPEMREEMSRYCKEVSYSRYTMEKMVENFSAAIEKAGAL